MEQIKVRDIVEATGGTLLSGDDGLSVTGVSTDSREIKAGDLFVPLSGERFDGHAFIENALEAGAAACFTVRARESYQDGKAYIQVTSPQRALRDLAAWYRWRFSIPCIAVTGSVGKTTAKDMIAAVLSTRYKVLKTEGNFNNEIGLPLTLLRLCREHEIAVLEMGMSAPGEIDYLSAIVEPNVAVITNIGDAHIEFLGSRENILKAKSEVFNHMNSSALAVLNADDELLLTVKDMLPFKAVTCGASADADYRADGLRSDGTHTLGCTVHLPGGTSMEAEVFALGGHMIYHVLYAAAVGEHFGLTPEEISRGIADFSPTKMRMNILHRADEITILDDAYNANPQSMRAAVEVLSGAKGKKKIAVLGDMFELGPLAPVLHEGIGAYLGRANIDCLVAVGELSRSIAQAAREAGMEQVYHCADKAQAKPVLRELLQSGCTVLLKASRGMAFEELTEYLCTLTKEKI